MHKKIKKDWINPSIGENQIIEKEFISWYELEQYSKMLAERIEYIDEFKYDTIIAITRGGLFVAGLLSHLLNVKRIETIGIEYYTGIGKTRKDPKLIKNPMIDYIKDQNVLIVDDLVDSGNTMDYVLGCIENSGAKNLKTAVLFKKPISKLEPDYYIRITDKWLVFPYENE